MLLGEFSLHLVCIYFFSITDISSSLLVGQGETANLECAVDANPLTLDTLSWRGRPGYDLEGKTKTAMGSIDPSKPHRRSIMLTILNATAEDSGRFWCVADNGVGGQEVKNSTYLLVRRKSV